jgi:hypothetical protein
LKILIYEVMINLEKYLNYKCKLTPSPSPKGRGDRAFSTSPLQRRGGEVTKYLLISLLLIFFLISCQDAPPTNYVPQVYVQAYLIVDEPIRNLILMQSQPTNVTFNPDSSLIRDALVRIKEDNINEYVLSFRDSGDKGYYLQDSTYLIKPQTNYYLDITLKDGTHITGQTQTPGRFKWNKPLKDTVYYPTDTLKLPAVDSLKFSWEKAPGIFGWYLISVTCLDTLGYGKYLNPVTDENNRRIYKPHEEYSADYTDITRWTGPIPNTETSFVWTVLRWYGSTQVSIYAPDYNMLRWFIQYQRSGFIDERLKSVNGALGVFGSASIIKKNTFIMKNQP